MYQRMAAAAHTDNLVFENIATQTCPSGYQRDSKTEKCW